MREYRMKVSEWPPIAGIPAFGYPKVLPIRPIWHTFSRSLSRRRGPGGDHRQVSRRGEPVLFQISAYLQVMCLQVAELLVDRRWSSGSIRAQRPSLAELGRNR